jgi:murein DD-endopeptidase MepM/ murein hydrolase activator NlpD
MTGGFLVAVIILVLGIILGAPRYAEPALADDDPGAADGVALAQVSESAAPSSEGTDEEAAEPDADLALATPLVTTSKPPDKLRGYMWPVRGGEVARYFEPDPTGLVQVDGRRIHDGIVITWFDGAYVKAAHKGTVVAAGRDWARYAGFEGPLDTLYSRFASGDRGKGGKPTFPMGVVIDDGNGYYSIYTELRDLLVKAGDVVKAGQAIGRMSRAERKQMMRYRLVRMDGPWMRVDEAARELGYPDYAHERVDPLVVLDTEAARMPLMRRKPPADPPRVSEY